jgi:hypothetical protein
MVAGGEAARLGPDGLAALGVIGKLPAGHAGPFKVGAQAEFMEFANRVGEKVEADAQGTDFGDGLKDLDRKTGFMKAEGGGQAADACADDENFVAGREGHWELPIAPFRCFRDRH